VQRFPDRREAGRMLARTLLRRDYADAIVVGLPRGGVPVAAEVADALSAPLDVLVVRKLGVPGHEEVAMGAVGENGTAVINQDVVTMARVPASALDAARRRESVEVDRRVEMFREGRAALELGGRTVIVVDDGLATGATARAGCTIARARGAADVVLAIPVAAPDALARVAEADEVVCVWTPPGFMAVGMHYVDFSPVEDEEVVALLRAETG